MTPHFLAIRSFRKKADSICYGKYLLWRMNKFNYNLRGYQKSFFSFIMQISNKDLCPIEFEPFLGSGSFI